MATSRPNSTLARREKRFPAMVGAFSPTHPHARRCCTMNELPTLTPPLSAEVASPRVLQGVGTLTGAAHPMPERGAIEVAWARHEDEVRQAQRLRFDVFAAEMGARLTTPIAGHDVDLFDDYCEHLLLRDVQSQQVIGTYRVLTPAQARRVGGTYSDTEFDLTRLRSLRPRMVELGRSCVHPDHRHGGVIMALWSALADFMVRNQLDTMIGCASIPMLPRLPLPVEQLDGSITVEPPALIKGYLRLGARVLGAPAWDPDFNTADLPMLMRLADLHPRYRKHFLGA